MTTTLRHGILLAGFLLLAALPAQAQIEPSSGPAAEPPLVEAAPRPRVVPLAVPTKSEAKAAPKKTRVVPLKAERRSKHQPSAAADVPVEGVLTVAVNKTRPLDLPAAAVDILLGNPALVDVVVRSPRQVYLLGRAPGSTNLFFLGEDGQVVRRLEVNVGSDVESVKAALRSLLPNEQIEVAAINDSIVLNGSVRSEAAAVQARAIARRFVAGDDRIVNMMRVTADTQVLLKVRVAEVQRTVLKELGVQFTDNQIPAVGQSFLFSGAPNANAFGAIGIGFGSSGLSIDALERNGVVRTLAEPNLTAMSGETARLLAGGEVPIPVAAQDGVVTVSYRPFGVSLAFTPVVMSNGRVSLRLETEVSQRQSENINIGNGITVPSFGVRRAASTVEMGSGGTLMMAGLLQNSDTSDMSQLPGVGNLPILGALFRSSSFNRNETELVITVSAFVVRPIEDSALMLPTDGFAPASDIDRILFGKLIKSYGRESAAPQGLAGPIGYIVK